MWASPQLPLFNIWVISNLNYGSSYKTGPRLVFVGLVFYEYSKMHFPCCLHRLSPAWKDYFLLVKGLVPLIEVQVELEVVIHVLLDHGQLFHFTSFWQAWLRVETNYPTRPKCILSPFEYKEVIVVHLPHITHPRDAHGKEFILQHWMLDLCSNL